MGRACAFSGPPPPLWKASDETHHPNSAHCTPGLGRGSCRLRRRVAVDTGRGPGGASADRPRSAPGRPAQPCREQGGRLVRVPELRRPDPPDRARPSDQGGGLGPRGGAGRSFPPRPHPDLRRHRRVDPRPGQVVGQDDQGRRDPADRQPRSRRDEPQSRRRRRVRLRRPGPEPAPTRSTPAPSDRSSTPASSSPTPTRRRRSAVRRTSPTRRPTSSGRWRTTRSRCCPCSRRSRPR